MVAPTNKNTIRKDTKEKKKEQLQERAGPHFRCYIKDHVLSDNLTLALTCHQHLSFKVPNSSSGYSLDPPWTIFSAFCFHPTRNSINSYPNLFSVPSSVCSAQHHFLNHHSPRFHAHPKCPFSARNPLLPSR